MIAGWFTNDGLPFVECNVFLPRFGLIGQVTFLVDTGSDTTILHPEATADLDCPFDLLDNPAEFISAGGVLLYYMEPAVLSSNDSDGGTREFEIEISIAKPDPVTDDLASLLGRDVLNRMHLDYDFPHNRLALHQD